MSSKQLYLERKREVQNYISGVTDVVPDGLQPAEVLTVNLMREARLGATVRLVQPHEVFANMGMVYTMDTPPAVAHATDNTPMQVDDVVTSAPTQTTNPVPESPNTSPRMRHVQMNVATMPPNKKQEYLARKQASMDYLTGRTDVPPDNTPEMLDILRRAREIRERALRHAAPRPNFNADN